jgi:Tfp pilus assembly protein PilP
VGVSEILAQIDQEIAQLQQARALLAGNSAPKVKRGPGRPPKSAAVPAAKKKRNLTPEGRRRIAEAVKRRWAEQKKSASSK